MVSKRERQLARERHERQLARRAAARAKARRRQQVVAAVVAVLAVFAATFGLTRLGGSDAPVSALPAGAGASTAGSAPATSSTDPSPAGGSPDPSAATAASPSPSAAATGPCTYSPTPAEPAAKDVGTPPASVASGAREARPYTATLETGRGRVTFEALTDAAPCTAASFRFLAEKKYFDATKCHRLTTKGIYVLQCGDPTGSGSGGPGYAFGIENAPADGRYPAGTVAMARTSDPNSNGSQFFLVYRDSRLPTAGGGYTVFGRITSGLDVLQGVAEAGAEPPGDGAPKAPVDIRRVRVKDA